MQDNLKKKSYKAFIWDFSGRFANQGVGFLVSIVLARLLEPSDFGLLAMLYVIIAISSGFMDTGLGRGLIQKQNITEEHYNSVFTFNILLGSVLAILFFVASDWIALFYNNPSIKNITKVLSLSFLLSSFGNVFRMKLQKELNLSMLTKSSLLGAIIGGILGIIAAFKGLGVWSLVIQNITTSLSSVLYLFYHAKWKPKLQLKILYLKDLWGFSLRVFFTDMIDLSFGQLDSLLIGKYFSSQKLGYYYRAKSFENLIFSYVGVTLGSVLFPAISKIQDDKERLNKIVIKLFHILTCASFFIIGILYLSSEDLFIILFSEKWINSVEYFKILLLASFVTPTSSLLMNAILGKGSANIFLKLGIIRRIPHLFFLITLPFYGINYFLYGMVFSNYFIYATTIYYVSKDLKLKQMAFWKPVLYHVSITCLTVLILLFANKYFNISNHYLNFVTMCSLFAIFYIGCCVVFKLKGYLYIKEELLPLLNKFTGK